MSNKKFIGGGFPGIRECIDEQNNITKESREKREFSVRKIIPINLILAKKNINKTNNFNLSEELNIQNDIKYNNSVDLYSEQNTNINKSFSNKDLDLINGPIRKNNDSKRNTNSKSKPKRNTNSKPKPKSNSKSKSKSKTSN